MDIDELAAEVATLKAQLAALLAKLDADAPNAQLNDTDYVEPIGAVTA